MELAAACESEIDRVAQPDVVDAGPAVDRTQQGHRPVGGGPAMVGSDAVEPGLDVCPADGVDRAGEPVAEVAVGLVAVEFVGPLRAVGVRVGMRAAGRRRSREKPPLTPDPVHHQLGAVKVAIGLTSAITSTSSRESFAKARQAATSISLS